MKNKKAFTLVELIVVITILAILGTIAFISLQGYSQDARDSTRVSDLSNIKSSLELFHLDAGKYPTPTSGVNITYSGGLVWTQGTFGNTVFTNVNKINKIPLDPLTVKEYTYSITSGKNEYELGGMIEGEIITMNLGKIGKVNAAGTIEAIAIVTGHYNGQMTKTLSGTNCGILAIPTIISNDIETSTDIVDIVTNNRLVYNGYYNLPASFRTSKFKVDGGFNFQPNNLLTYSDTGSCNELINKTSYTARVNMLKGLQDAYSGTILKNIGEIKSILNLSIDTNIPSQEVINYAGNFVNNNLGGNIGIGTTNSNAGFSCNSNTPNNASTSIGTPTTSNQNWQSSDPGNPCYFTCNIGYGSTGTDCIASTDCNPTITEITLSNSQTWSCINLGASQVRDGTTPPQNCAGSSTNCNSGLTWAGDYYQWGKNDLAWATGSSVAPYYFGWETRNDNKWGGGTTNASSGTYQTVGASNQLLMKGPCPNGWHVPTAYEWKMACDAITGTNCTNNATSSNAVKIKLKLPPMSYRYYYDGNYTTNNGNGWYWSSTPFNEYGSLLYYDANYIYTGNGSYDYRADGMSMRCLKN